MAFRYRTATSADHLALPNLTHSLTRNYHKLWVMRAPCARQIDCVWCIWNDCVHHVVISMENVRHRTRVHKRLPNMNPSIFNRMVVISRERLGPQFWGLEDTFWPDRWPNRRSTYTHDFPIILNTKCCFTSTTMVRMDCGLCGDKVRVYLKGRPPYSFLILSQIWCRQI